MKKRTIALLLAVTLAGGLTACGGETPPPPTAAGTPQPVCLLPARGRRLRGGRLRGGDASGRTPPSRRPGRRQQFQAPGGELRRGPGGTPPRLQPAVTSPPRRGTQPSPRLRSPTVTAPEPEPERDPEPPEPSADPEPEPVAATADAARAYIGQSASSLIAAIGSPISSSYAPSCLGPGEDGELIYDGFTVYTYRENGVETVEDVL